jgi:hypothetical protein
MEMKQIISQVLIAALSVIGFYGILHAVFETVLRPGQITSAVVVRSMKDAEDLDILLCEARRAPCKGAKRRLFLIVSADLMEGLVGEAGKLKEEYAILADRYGAEVAVWPPTETKHKNE